MLISFRTLNHRSIADEQVLTFEVGSKKYNHGELEAVKVEAGGTSLLVAAAIYGSNASGKTNFLDALLYMKTAVTESARFWAIDDGTFREPFAWGEKKLNPSLFEVDFVLNGIKYVYGFVVDGQVVLQEWLRAYVNKGKPQEWFFRDKNEIKYGTTFKKKNPKTVEKLQAIESLVRENALLLSVATQMRVDGFVDVYRFFSRMYFINLPLRRSSGRPNRRQVRSPTGHLMGELLSAEGFVNFFGEGTDYEDNKAFVREMLRQADVGVKDVKQDEDGEFYFLHNSADSDSWLHYDQESNGTKTIFKLLPYLMYALSSGGLLVVDEIELSLHSIIASRLIAMFSNEKINLNNAQIVFTTHDTNLLGNMLGDDLLRRDQVWFAEKDNLGETKIYPLTSFEPRKDENKERGYLQGRYGAIPVLNEFVLSQVRGSK